MFSRRISFVLVSAALFAAACSRKPSPDSGSADAGAAADAARPGNLEIGFTGTTVDGARIDLPLIEGSRAVIPPIQALELHGNLGLQNYQVRVFDEADRALESNDSSEAFDAGFRYDIRFPEPLKTGYRYVLVVDAENGPLMRDSAGHEHGEIRREFQIEGEKQKPEPPPAKKSKSKRRRH